MEKEVTLNIEFRRTTNRFVSYVFLILFFLAGVNSIATAATSLEDEYRATLGVARDAKGTDIEKAYRKLVMKYHPDRLPKASRQDVLSAEQKLKQVNEAFAYLSGKKSRQDRQAAEARRGEKSAVHPSTEKQAKKDIYAERDRTLQNLRVYYSRGQADPAAELRLLREVFSMSKYDLEHLLRDSKLVQFIAASELWKDPRNKLLDLFIERWGLYTFKTSTDVLLQIFSSLDLRDPRLKAVLFDFDFRSPGNDFQKPTGRQSWLTLASARLLTKEKYRGTAAGEKLLEVHYQLWQQMKSGVDLSPYPRDLWAIEVIEWLNLPEYRRHPKVVEMAQETSTLLDERVLGISGSFTESSIVKRYRALLESHGPVFAGTLVNSPMDDLNWFYNRLTAAQRKSRPEVEIKVISRLLNLGKYDFESAMRDPNWNVIIGKIGASSIWADESNGLFDLFIERAGFYRLRYSTEFLGRMLSQLDPDSRALKRVIYDGNFGRNTGSDFEDRSKRVRFLRLMVTSLLKQKSDLGTPAGDQLVGHMENLWRDFKRNLHEEIFFSTAWIVGILKTMEKIELRSDPRMQAIYRDIPEIVANPRFKFDYNLDREMFERQLVKYADTFNGTFRRASSSDLPPTEPTKKTWPWTANTKPAAPQPAAPQPVAPNDSVSVFCRILFGGK